MNRITWQTLTLSLAALALLFHGAAFAGVRHVRATALTPEALDVRDGETVIVEFRRDDRLPITIRAEGDLIESVDSQPTFVSVKRDFWVRFTQTEVALSLDGQSYRPFTDSVTGNINVGALANPGDGVANAVQVLFHAVLK